MLPLWVFRRRVLTGGTLATFGVGALLIGLSSYVPTYVQGVLGTGALVAGFALAALSIGWPIAATFAGRIYIRIGFRNTALIGSVFVVTGAVLCALLPEGAQVWQVGGAAFVVGIGLGLTASPTLVAVQSVVGWDRRGVVTGDQHVRQIDGQRGGCGRVRGDRQLDADQPAVPPAGVGRAGVGRQGLGHDQPGARRPDPTHDAGVAAFVRDALYAASHHVFVSLIVVAVLGASACC